MADVVQKYYEALFDLALRPQNKIQVKGDFHAQVKQINKLLNQDYTGLVSTVLEFMVHCATVDITLDSDNTTVKKVLDDWKQNVNANLNIDIPRGLRSFTEQYFRERWKSSFIVTKVRWNKKNGFIVPSRLWLMAGNSVYVKNEEGNLNSNKYYFGKPDKDEKNQLKPTQNESVYVRKPYNQWYDEYPTPYLVRKGTLYHAIFKERVLQRQAEVVNTAIPYQWFIKMGCEAAMKSGMMPTSDQLKKMEKKFKDLKKDFDEHVWAKGEIGAFPFDTKFEEMIPDYAKALDEKLLKATDKYLLSSLGLIELKGFSTTREEAILNPKVLIEEVEDAVLDYVELLDDIFYEFREKNKKEHPTLTNNSIRISSGIIKSFITDEMRVMIRSWYDRGLIAKQDAVENTTPLNFETQINRRDKERKDRLNFRMYPPVTQNLEKDFNDPSEPKPTEDDIPEDKKPGTPESDNYINAHQLVICQKCKKEIDYSQVPEAGMGYIKCPNCGTNIDQEGKYHIATEEIDLITEPIKTIRSIPNDIRKHMNKAEQGIFKEAFNVAFKNATELQMDDALRETTALEYALKKYKEYIQAPYDKNSDLPESVRNVLPQHAQTIFRKTFNSALKQGLSEERAFKVAWSAVKKIYKKVKDKWVKK